MLRAGPESWSSHLCQVFRKLQNWRNPLTYLIPLSLPQAGASGFQHGTMSLGFLSGARVPCLACQFLFFFSLRRLPVAFRKANWEWKSPFLFSTASSPTGATGWESPEQIHSAGQCLEQICIAGFSSTSRVLLGVSSEMVGWSPLGCLNNDHFPKQCACAENPSW